MDCALRTRLINTWAVLTKRGSPIPVNLTARLLAHGVDVSVLERRYGV
jgi:hypothetical protein